MKHIQRRSCEHVHNENKDLYGHRAPSKFHQHPEWLTQKFVYKAKDMPMQIYAKDYKSVVENMKKLIVPKKTSLQPFSFDERDKRAIQKREERIKQIIEQERKMREYRARPLPDWVMKRSSSVPTYSKGDMTNQPRLLARHLDQKSTLRNGVYKAVKFCHKMSSIRNNLSETKQNPLPSTELSKVTESGDQRFNQADPVTAGINNNNNSKNKHPNKHELKEKNMSPCVKTKPVLSQSLTFIGNKTVTEKSSLNAMENQITSEKASILTVPKNKCMGDKLNTKYLQQSVAAQVNKLAGSPKKHIQQNSKLILKAKNTSIARTINHPNSVCVAGSINASNRTSKMKNTSSIKNIKMKQTRVLPLQIKCAKSSVKEPIKKSLALQKNIQRTARKYPLKLDLIPRTRVSRINKLKRVTNTISAITKAKTLSPRKRGFKDHTNAHIKKKLKKKIRKALVKHLNCDKNKLKTNENTIKKILCKCNSTKKKSTATKESDREKRNCGHCKMGQQIRVKNFPKKPQAKLNILSREFEIQKNNLDLMRLNEYNFNKREPVTPILSGNSFIRRYTPEVEPIRSQENDRRILEVFNGIKDLKRCIANSNADLSYNFKLDN